jgi:hypothetical protein
VSVCIIDDCDGRDLPLVEMTATQVEVSLKRSAEEGAKSTGAAAGTIAGSYYNTAVSAWEPFLEPWRLALQWSVTNVIPTSSGGADCSSSRSPCSVLLAADDRLEINITPHFLKSMSSAAASWKADYHRHLPLPVRGFLRKFCFVISRYAIFLGANFVYSVPVAQQHRLHDGVLAGDRGWGSTRHCSSRA